MASSHDGSDLSRIGGLVDMAYERQRSQQSSLPAVRARLLAPPRRRPSPLRHLRWFLPATALAATAILALVVLPATEKPLTFELDNGRSNLARTWIEAPQSYPRLIDFSDGSAVVLEPQARLRIDGLQARGAELKLGRGSALIRVKPRAKNRWTVRAGPFRVRVVGTKFRVSWDPATRRFDLDLERGKVIVDGPRLRRRRLVSGQQISVVAATRRVARRVLVHSPPPAQPVDKQAPVAARPIQKRGSVAARPVQKQSSPRATRSRETRRERAEPLRPEKVWSLLATQNTRSAIALAEKIGWQRLCNAGTAQQLLRLADAALQARRISAGSQVYGAVRKRFAATADAARAAFELGRIAARRKHSLQAIDWFNRYLAERPGGTLAPLARGRLIEALVEAGQHRRARLAAVHYLEKHPRGPHAGLARKLVRAKTPAEGKEQR